MYQPQVDARQNITIGAEALLRWQHPVYGLIPPNITVALAEDIDLISELGMRILEDACVHHAVLLNKIGKKQVLSVNMSAMQFEDTKLVEKVMHILDKTGIAPEMLKVEITESIALKPEEKTISMLKRLRNKGIRVAIDDFGMGHTSLRYLKEFPVDTVKIDKSLTQEIPGGINDHIIASIVSLCDALGIQIIVEGVETHSQLERFKSQGCYLFQGYLFSRPLTGEDYMARLIAS